MSRELFSYIHPEGAPDVPQALRASESAERQPEGGWYALVKDRIGKHAKIAALSVLAWMATSHAEIEPQHVREISEGPKKNMAIECMMGEHKQVRLTFESLESFDPSVEGRDLRVNDRQVKDYLGDDSVVHPYNELEEVPLLRALVQEGLAHDSVLRAGEIASSEELKHPTPRQAVLLARAIAEQFVAERPDVRAPYAGDFFKLALQEIGQTHGALLGHTYVSVEHTVRANNAGTRSDHTWALVKQVQDTNGDGVVDSIETVLIDPTRQGDVSERKGEDFALTLVYGGIAKLRSEEKLSMAQYVALYDAARDSLTNESELEYVTAVFASGARTADEFNYFGLPVPDLSKLPSAVPEDGGDDGTTIGTDRQSI